MLDEAFCSRELVKENWFKYLSEGQKDLALQALDLLKKEKIGNNKFHDYSFVVFPMAKAYEGFLKKFFLEAGLIDEKTYSGDRFRIGKALNPALGQKHRGNWWLWGPLTQACGGKEVPDLLWKAWKECRNLLFHFFPGHKHFIALEEADSKITQLVNAMKSALRCGVIDEKTKI